MHIISNKEIISNIKILYRIDTLEFSGFCLTHRADNFFQINQSDHHILTARLFSTNQS